VDGIAEPSLRVLAKNVQVMPGRLRHRVEALRAMTVTGGSGGPGRTDVDPDVLTSVALACRDAERLRFAYTAADGRRTDRHVEPLRLVSLGRRWYHVAYDLDRADWRTLRVDRIADPAGTGARFRPRELPADDAAEFVRAHIGAAPRPHRIEVLADAPAAAVRARVGRWADVDEDGPDRCRLRFTSDSLDWAALAAGAIGADFRVLHPPELVDMLRDWADRFHRATSVSGDPRDG
jgi:predicted DNA-binding transcriptional regulator YafY